MFSEFLVKIPYLIYFIPLLGSVFIHFISGRRFLTNCTYSILLALFLLSLKLIFHIENYDGTLIVNSSTRYNVMGTEFRVSLYNMFVLITILFVNFIGFINYIHEIILNKQSNIPYIKHFFSIYLMYIFAIIGIVLTSNIFHLFIFLEIYSFCMYLMITNYKKEDLTILSYKYFSNNIFGSILNMLTIFYIVLYFNTSDMFTIKQQLMTISIRDNLGIFLMFLLFICSIVMRFFNTNTSKHHNTNNVGVNFLSISNIFVNTLIGVYLINTIANFIFTNQTMFNILFIRGLVIIITSIVIIYNSYLLINKDNTSNMFNIFIRMDLINFGFLLLTSFLSIDNKMSLMFLVDFVSINMLLYFFSAYLSAKYKTNDIRILNNDLKLKCFFVFIIVLKVFLPIGTCLYTNYLFLIYLIKNAYFIVLAPFLLSKVAIGILLFKVITNKDRFDLSDEIMVNKKCVGNLLLSVGLIAVYVVFFGIFAGMVG